MLMAAKSTLPLPRLRNCPIGTSIRLSGQSKTLTILSTDAHYAHFTGDDKASLCCPVAAEMMAFGDGGWRPILKERE